VVPVRRLLVQADAAGDWSLRVPELGLGTTLVQARVLGRGGAIASPPSAIATIVAESGLTIDVPGMPVHGYLPALTGSALPGATVRMTIDGEDLREAVAGVEGTWSIDLSDLVEGGTHWLAVWQQTGLFAHPSVALPLVVDPYLDETWAVIDRWDALGVPAPKAREDLLDGFFVAITAAEVVEDLDAIHLTAAHAEAAARVNLLSPATGLIPVNSPVFTPDRGYTGDGVSSYLNLGIAPGSPGLKLDNNSFSAGFWCLLEAAANTLEFSQTSAGNFYLRARTVSGRSEGRCFGAGATSRPVSSAIGFTAVVRTDASGFVLVRDDDVIATLEDPSTDFATTNFTLLRRASAYSAQQVGFAFIGRGPTPPRRAALKTAALAWLTGVGALAA
jgi:hypothetical protein